MGELAELSDEDVKSGLEDQDDSDVAEMSQDLPPSSPELYCVGCDISSKSECPIEKLKKRKGIGDGTNTLVVWGKTSPRSVWKKGRKGRRYKKKMFKKCGEWCSVCSAVAKKFLQKG